MDQIQSWMERKDVDTTCPAGVNTSWVTSEIIAPRVRSRTRPLEEGLQVPMVQLSCDDCGYVWLFSAVKMGLL
jgi:hypothetical protein